MGKPMFRVMAALGGAAAAVLMGGCGSSHADDPPVPPGQYRYVKEDLWMLDYLDPHDSCPASLVERVIETWIPPNPADQWMRRWSWTGARKWLAPPDEHCKPRNDPSVDETTARCGDWLVREAEQCAPRQRYWSHPMPDFLESAPTNPEELYQSLEREETNGPRTINTLNTASSALSSGLVPVQTRQNIYVALLLAGKFSVTPDKADGAGRRAVALSATENGERVEVFIDPGSGELLGSRSTYVIERADLDVPSGTIKSDTSVTTAVVSALGVQPR